MSRIDPTATLIISDKVGDTGNLILPPEDRTTKPWGEMWAHKWFEGDPASISIALDLADTLSAGPGYTPDLYAFEEALGITVRWVDAA